VHIHQQELAEERQKNIIKERTAHDELARLRQVAQMKDASTISFAKLWLERHIHWAANHAEVQKGAEEWKAAWVAKADKRNVRVCDQKVRLKKYNEFKWELRQLRRSVQATSAEREKKRLEHRRKAVREELERMADTASTTRNMANLKPSTTISSKPSRMRSLPQRHVACPRRNFPRFEFERFGADFVSASTPTPPTACTSMLNMSVSAPTLNASVSTMSSFETPPIDEPIDRPHNLPHGKLNKADIFAKLL